MADAVVLGLSMKSPWGDLISQGKKRIENRRWAPKKPHDWVALVNNAKHPTLPSHCNCLIKIGSVLRPADALRLMPEQTEYIHVAPAGRCWAISHLLPLPTPIKCDGGGALGPWEFKDKNEAALQAIRHVLKDSPKVKEFKLSEDVLASDMRIKISKKPRKRKRPTPAATPVAEAPTLTATLVALEASSCPAKREREKKQKIHEQVEKKCQLAPEISPKEASRGSTLQPLTCNSPL